MRIIVADPHPQSRKFLIDLCSDIDKDSHIQAAASLESLLLLADEFPADLVLLDKDLSDRPIGNLIAELHGREPRPVVIVLSSSPEISRSVLRAGADSFISKVDSPEMLLECLHRYEADIRQRESSRNVR